MKLKISYYKKYIDSTLKLKEELYKNFPKCEVVTEEIDNDNFRVEVLGYNLTGGLNMQTPGAWLWDKENKRDELPYTIGITKSGCGTVSGILVHWIIHDMIDYEDSRIFKERWHNNKFPIPDYGTYTYSKVESPHIFWSGGFDSTFLVCKKLIIDREPIETYYLNFPCDGYQKNYNKFVSTNFDNCMVNNKTNVVEEDLYGRKSYGRYSRFVEIGIMNKLREMIIDKFPYTKDMFPKVNLIDEFEIDSKVLKDSKVICDKYNSRPDRPDQTLYMCQFSLDLGKDISVALEADMDGEDYCLSTRLVRKHLSDELKVENDLVEELWLYKNWVLPLAKTYRKEMLETAKEYDFVDILKYTWSCRFPKENGDVCDDCTLGVKEIERVNNYKDILCMTI